GRASLAGLSGAPVSSPARDEVAESDAGEDTGAPPKSECTRGLRYDVTMTAVDQRVDPAPQQDVNADLGFGSVVARESRQRFLNRDGTFNVRRDGLGFWQSLSAYNYLLSLSWPKFLGCVALAYIATNTIFAMLYVTAGAHALTAFGNEAAPLRFATAFFFSVQTLATIGYGSVAPA